MGFIVIEIQTLQEGQVAIPPAWTYTDRNAAEAQYHSILSVAAASTIPVHAAILMTERGQVLKHEDYEHEEA